MKLARLPGLTLPGLANDHSHAFHRALRGRTQRERGTFWTWREQMYAVAGRLDPGHLPRAGPGDVPRDGGGGLHRGGRVPLPAPPARRDAVRRPERDGRRAASRPRPRPGSGSRCSTPATSAAGSGAPPRGRPAALQRRRPPSAWAERGARADGAWRRADPLGARGARATSCRVVRAAARAPLHVHLSEQVAENDACLAAYGVTPTRLLARRRRCSDRGTTAVHATHLTDDDIALLGATGTQRLLLPRPPSATSADGIGPARRLHDGRAAGSPSAATATRWSTRSRSCAAVELDERLATAGARPLDRRRAARAGTSTATPLGFGDAGGSRSAPRADLVTARHRPARAPPAPAPTSTPRSSPPPPPTSSRSSSTVGSCSRRATTRRSAASSTRRSRSSGDEPRTAGHRHRRAGHQRPASADGPARASSPTPRSSSRAAGSPGSARPPRRRPPTSASTPAAARCCPGFVDTHSHLVFAGDRARGVRGPDGRDAVRRAAASAPRSPPPGRPPTSSSTAHVARLVAEMRRQGTTTVEIKSGYGLTVHDEARSLASRGSSPTRRRSSARTSCPPSTPTTRPATSTWSPGRCSRPRAPHARWIDVFCERGAFDADQARAVLAAGAARGLRGRLHANQLGPGPASGWPPSSGWPRSTTAPTSTTPTSTRCATAGTVATLLPGVEFSTRAALPRRARGCSTPASRSRWPATATPGSCYTTSMPFCIALAVREMGMTPAEAVHAATHGGAAALDRDDVGVLAAGQARRPACCWTPRSHVHLAYRPGRPAGRRHLDRRPAGLTPAVRAGSATVAPNLAAA